MELTTRQAKILGAVIEIYVADGSPVSSGEIARRIDAGVPKRGTSPATVRSELATLTRSGLLEQQRANAGRIPTEKGLRAYLDQVMSPRLNPWDRTHLDEAARVKPNELPLHLGQMLARLSGELTVLGVPRFVGRTFREVGLASVGPRRLLAYFVSPGGDVQQRLVDVAFSLSTDEVARVQNYLNAQLTHRTLSEVRDLLERELARDLAEHDVLRRRALEIGLKALPEPELDLLIEGTGKLAAKPELNKERLEQLLRAIETKTALLELLRHVIDGPEVTIKLGSEHQVAEVVDLACVGSACSGLGGRRVTISILGPPRMDYQRLVPLVRYAKDLFERHWKPF